MQQKIIILDFGSQTTQLIGRRVREMDTFCEILPYNKFPENDEGIIGVILSGSPLSVYDKDAFRVDFSQFVGKYPVLGICYGAQLMSYCWGGKVEPAGSREYGRAHLKQFDATDPLFKGFEENSQVWMSHGDTITALPAGFHCIASTIPGATETIAIDQAIVAVGVSPNPIVPTSIQGLELGRKNTIVVNEGMQTNIPTIFAGGDIVRGGATVILAMGDGRRAAAAMHEYLSK